MEPTIAPGSPTDPDVQALVGAHLAFAHASSPAEHVHALDTGRLTDPMLTFFTARLSGELIGVGALRELDVDRGEVKSMHVAAAARGRGIGRGVLAHLLAVAVERGYRQVLLETGTTDEFAAARRLYTSAGFRECPPFGEYTVNPFSVCMALDLPAAHDRTAP